MPARPKVLKPERSARDLFGSKLRARREREGLSLEKLAGLVKVSKSHLSRIETAEVMPPPQLPALLDVAFSTDGIFEELYALACREAHPDPFARYKALEVCAQRIQEYSGQFIPGLLQTEGYARCLFETADPRKSPEAIEELLVERMARQAVLCSDSPPDHSVVLDEEALWRGFGGAAVMRDQLALLARLTLTATTTLQVVPLAHGGHALTGSSLNMLTLGDGTQVALEEGNSRRALLEDAVTVRKRQRSFDVLRSCALSPKDSATLIRSVMETLPGEPES
ncbi:Scr1 family TA system antitoxin-like transcriptional regulator [Streptomyces gamaensis]|uniref:Scr1 family TA system antitoxin-like transcriptional regulator n=1 Tax=Streptomyces gamaensis TaxID=1763542 RepID=A0ABW0YZV1_9ACTN